MAAAVDTAVLPSSLDPSGATDSIAATVGGATREITAAAAADQTDRLHARELRLLAPGVGRSLGLLAARRDASAASATSRLAAIASTTENP